MLKDRNGLALLRTLASNGNYTMANDILKKMKNKPVEAKLCDLCQERLMSVEHLTRIALNKLEEYEYSTVLVGLELPIEVEEREDEFKAEFTITRGESLRNEFSRTIGKRIAEASGKEIDFERPDIVVLVNPWTEQVTLQVNPIHIGGKYRKLVRDIPQSRWFCKSCRGKGCKQCNWTGRKYPESIEEIISNPAVNMAHGKGFSFHGAGREDVDARMLGSGRPFVTEVKRPKRRKIDLEALEKIINSAAQGKVAVSKLCFANKDFVRKLKRGDEAQKFYRATVETDKPISQGQLAALKKALTNVNVKQQTPKRVAYCRADLMREKYIYKANVKRLTPKRFELEIRCQGGLYIKELITGDDGRTVPNVTQILGAKAIPIELDVLGVYITEEK
jgi:tRNA pseudouridine synthase 10